MLYEIKNNNIIAFNVLTNYCNTKILKNSFDPWEPESTIDTAGNYLAINKVDMLTNIMLSFDQKKLAYLMSSNPN